MSRIFSKLRNLQEEKPLGQVTVGSVTPVMQQEVEKKHFPVFLVLGVVSALGVMYTLGSLSSNIGTIKNNIFVKMDANIHEQQNQIIDLNKKLITMQSSMDERIRKTETAIDLNKNMMAQLSAINSSVNAKLDQASVNADRMEATLQTNIDALNNKLNKLQSSMQAQAVSPTTTGDQTATATAN